ncbi:transposase family protein [Hamadaea sp. NPDC051192]|uniref:transposase family protein n=1 Tax=Hamadaea sp. NPDC051192 TaxID=3154940 RepID=UPI0034167258
MTGLATDQVDQLVRLVYADVGFVAGRRRAVGPYPAVIVVLLYLRHNVSQALLAELFGCSQPTVSRLVDRFLPVITTALAPLAEHVAAKELNSTVRVDGFLAPTGDRRAHSFTSGMYSGKRHRCGFNIQVVRSVRGTLTLIGQPLPGATHDAKAWHESGLAQRFAGRLHTDGGPGGFADTAYIGTGLCVPDRKPKGQPLTASAREFNRMIASHRASVERVIAHVKNWRILSTGYRGMLDRFPAYLDAVAKLEIYRTSYLAAGPVRASEGRQ